MYKVHVDPTSLEYVRQVIDEMDKITVQMIQYQAMMSKCLQKYTNHSICATVITMLDNNGVEARHIIKLSSHKYEATIKEYACECPNNKSKEMYSYFSEAITAKN